MNRISVLIAALSATFASPALAQEVYVGAQAGVVIPDPVEFQTERSQLNLPVQNGWAGGAVIGLDFGPVRLELEGMHKLATVGDHIREGTRFYEVARGKEEGSHQLHRSLMLNGWIDVKANEDVTFYFGGGGGITEITMRAKNGENCRERVAIRITRAEDEQREGPSGTCRDQGRSTDLGLTWKAGFGMDLFLAPRLSVGPQANFTQVRDVWTSAKILRTREVREEKNLNYNSFNGLISVKYRL